MSRPDHIFYDFVACRRERQFWRGADAADDGDFGDTIWGRGGEGAGESGEERAEGSWAEEKGRHWGVAGGGGVGRRGWRVNVCQETFGEGLDFG